jgi:hypothetical protein
MESASRIAPISGAQVRQVLLTGKRPGTGPGTWLREEAVGTGTARTVIYFLCSACLIGTRHWRAPFRALQGEDLGGV